MVADTFLSLAVNLLRAGQLCGLLVSVVFLLCEQRALNTTSLRELFPALLAMWDSWKMSRDSDCCRWPISFIFAAGENCGDADGCATLCAGELWRSDRDGRGVIVR